MTTVIDGPPGCGKTTKIVEIVSRDHADERVVLLSHTRAAASDLARRCGRDLDDGWTTVGTLNALGYACAKAENRRVKTIGWQETQQWNEEYPRLKVEGRGKRMTEAAVLLEEISQYRGRAINFDMWRPREQELHEMRTAWKRRKGYVDFDDQIDAALRADRPEGSGDVMFVDEAQDLSTAQWNVIDKWQKNLPLTYLIGDADQDLYEWRGSDISRLRLYDGDDDITLSQSYRVPRAVHEVATNWITQLGEARKDVKYEPRDVDGTVTMGRYSIEHIDLVVADVERRLAEGRSVMVLAWANSWVDPIKKELKRRGTPDKALQIGTIHGHKGREADDVLLAPDMWPNMVENWPAAVRVFYVAVTRARENLLVMQSARPNYARLAVR